jgi:hypothetical protein
MAQNQAHMSQDLSTLSKAALDAEIAKIRTAAAKNQKRVNSPWRTSTY